jgi:ribosomal protein S28E/S33
MVYLLRTANGRTYVVTQALATPLRVGDIVEIEPAGAKEAVKIRVR